MTSETAAALLNIPTLRGTQAHLAPAIIEYTGTAATRSELSTTRSTFRFRRTRVNSGGVPRLPCTSTVFPLIAPFGWKVFQPRDCKTICVAVHILSDYPTATKTTFFSPVRTASTVHCLTMLTALYSRAKRGGRVQTRRTRHQHRCALAGAVTWRGTSTTSCSSVHSRGSSRLSL